MAREENWVWFSCSNSALSCRIFVQILDKMVNNKDFLKIINKPIMLLYAFAYVVWLDSFFCQNVKIWWFCKTKNSWKQQMTAAAFKWRIWSKLSVLDFMAWIFTRKLCEGRNLTKKATLYYWAFFLQLWTALNRQEICLPFFQ